MPIDAVLTASSAGLGCKLENSDLGLKQPRATSDLSQWKVIRVRAPSPSFVCMPSVQQRGRSGPRAQGVVGWQATCLAGA
jgi:hypothetical protein